jgi:hypothetical protein
MNMNTSQHPNSLSRIFPNKAVAITFEIFLLISAGVLAAVLMQKLKVPMHLPGKQGILFLLIIISSARSSRLPMAATIATSGSAFFLYMFAFDSTDVFKPLLLMIVAAGLDAIIYLHRNKTIGNIAFIILAGAVWTLMPLIKLVISLFTGFPFPSFISGFAYPFATHLLFGVIAATLALFTLRLFKK